MRSFAVIALLIMGGLACPQANGGPVYKLVRRHGWLFGPGYHAFTCCQQCPNQGGAIDSPTALPPPPPESINTPMRVGYLPRRYPLGYPLISNATPAIPLTGVQPIRLPLVTPEVGIPDVDAVIQQPEAAVARDIFMSPPVHRQ